MIVHTAVDDRATVIRLLKVGAIGYLVKGTAPSEILGAIRRAARGQTSVSPEVMSAMVHDLSEQLSRDEVVTSERRERVERISRAIEGEGRTLVYQPIVELDGLALVGYEALSRFAAEPVRTPDLWFAEAAERRPRRRPRAGANRAALADLAGCPRTSTCRSTPRIARPRRASLLDELDAVEGSRVVVEITEHEAVDDYGALTRALGRVRERGRAWRSTTPAPGSPACATSC